MTTETTQQSEHTPLEKPLGRCMGWHCSEERPNLLERLRKMEDALRKARVAIATWSPDPTEPLDEIDAALTE